MRSLGAVDSVKEYRQMAEQLREQELQRALRALARGDDPQQIVAQLAHTITNKLIHAPTAGLKQASAEGRLDTVASARKLLGLEPTGPAQVSTQAPIVATETDEQDDFDLPPSTVETSRRTLQ
jgi:glutamyl-tRNA reductase